MKQVNNFIYFISFLLYLIKQSEMFRDQSPLNTLRQLSNRLDEAFNINSPASLKSIQIKPVHRQMSYKQKGNDEKSFYERVAFKKYRPYSSFSAFMRKDQDSYNHGYPWSRQHQNLKLSKYRLLTQNQPCDFSKLASDLIGSQSANRAYKNQRIELLKKMNILLQNNTINKQPIQVKPSENQHKFKIQISAKLDRLQGYLLKIKKQRERQLIPTNKTKRPARDVNRPNQNIQKVGPNTQVPDKIPIQFSRAFQELEKIKKQLVQIRKEAVLARQSNGVPEVRSSDQIKIKAVSTQQLGNCLLLNNPQETDQSCKQDWPKTIRPVLYHQINRQARSRKFPFQEQRANYHFNPKTQPQTPYLNTQSPRNPQTKPLHNSSNKSVPKIKFNFVSKPQF